MSKPLQEGRVRKGGINRTAPTTPRPAPPAATRPKQPQFQQQGLTPEMVKRISEEVERLLWEVDPHPYAESVKERTQTFLQRLTGGA